MLVAAAAVRGAGPQHGLLQDVLIHVLHQVLHVCIDRVEIIIWLTVTNLFSSFGQSVSYQQNIRRFLYFDTEGVVVDRNHLSYTTC